MIALIYRKGDGIRAHAVADGCKLRRCISQFVHDGSICLQAESRYDGVAFQNDIFSLFGADDAGFLYFFTSAVRINFDANFLIFFMRSGR